MVEARGSPTPRRRRRRRRRCRLRPIFLFLMRDALVVERKRERAKPSRAKLRDVQARPQDRTMFIAVAIRLFLAARFSLWLSSDRAFGFSESGSLGIIVVLGAPVALPIIGKRSRTYREIVFDGCALGDAKLFARRAILKRRDALERRRKGLASKYLIDVNFSVIARIKLLSRVIY